MKRFLSLLLSVGLLTSCGNSKKLPDEPTSENVDNQEVVSIVQSSPYANFKRTETKAWDLIHTKLDISFDWDSAHVIGNASLDISPHFYSQKSLQLDAREFSISYVNVFHDAEKLESNWAYDGETIDISLLKAVSAVDTITVKVSYVAHPEKIEGGGRAITAAQGMYFIRHEQAKDSIVQIWTQGETEYNSGWFPTLDVPNQKTSQEIDVTVPKHLATVSNGRLKYAMDNGDGTRTDVWEQVKPHAPYLVMLAVGDYAKIADDYKGMEVSYYVDSSHAADARHIFGHTPEMLEFFSQLLDYPFPWDKYAQVIAREFVSGAMENTSATIHGDFVQKSRRELLDAPQDDIIAHELMHQWFGDLVTCESWSNLTLNEGFATYGEYLWREYKYGKDDADLLMLNKWRSYYRSALRQEKNLIRYDYDEPDHMFDAHSYSKGGLILHYLRSEMGDRAFFKALSLYLKEHEFSTVEVHDLRHAFEEVTGIDYLPFFEQWFLGSGHPQVAFEVVSNADSTWLLVKQDTAGIFLPSIPIRFYGAAAHEDVMFETNQYIDSLSLNPYEGYVLIQPNPDYVVPGLFNIERKADDYFHQYWLGKNIRDKVEVLTYYASIDSLSPKQIAVVSDALEHPHHAIRKQAFLLLNGSLSNQDKQLLQERVKVGLNDDHAHVRKAALSVSPVFFDGSELEVVYLNALKDSSYNVMSTSLTGYGTRYPEKALPKARELSESENDAVQQAAYSVLALYGNEQDAMYFKKLSNVDYSFPNWKLLSSYVDYVLAHPTSENIAQLIERLEVVDDSYLKFHSFYQRIVGRSLEHLLESVQGNDSVEEKVERQLESYITAQFSE